MKGQMMRRYILFLLLLTQLSCERITSPINSSIQKVYYYDISYSDSIRNENIVSMNFDGSNLENLTQDLPGNKLFGYYCVSVDGSKLFCRYLNQNSNKRVNFLLNLETGGIEELEFENVFSIWYPSFSPDGSMLLFSNYPNTYIYNLATKRLNKLTENFIGYLACFSPDGRSIAMIADDGNLLLMNSNGTEIRKITNLNINQSLMNSFEFSPNSQQIIYGIQDGQSGHQKYYTINPDGTNPSEVISVQETFSDSVIVLGYPKYTSNGKSICFILSGILQGESSTYIYRQNLQNGELKQLIKAKYRITSFDISPFGSNIFYVDDSAQQIFRMDLDGTTCIQITYPPSNKKGVGLVPISWAIRGSAG
jgi:Tol biopolymer transport system component